mgnify:CR=1 FL=1
MTHLNIGQPIEDQDRQDDARAIDYGSYAGTYG